MSDRPRDTRMRVECACGWVGEGERSQGKGSNESDRVVGVEFAFIDHDATR
jgi:hypothetical protein